MSREIQKNSDATKSRSEGTTTTTSTAPHTARLKTEASDSLVGGEFNEIFRHLKVLDLVKLQNNSKSLNLNMKIALTNANTGTNLLSYNSGNPGGPLFEKHHLEPARKEQKERKEELEEEKEEESQFAEVKKRAIQVERGHFEPKEHFYPKVLGKTVHPVVGSFFELNNEQRMHRYVQLNPGADLDKLRELLNYVPKHFKWAGADLFNVRDAQGKRNMVIIETNSCPSGQKSMPLLRESEPLAGYKRLLDKIFKEFTMHGESLKEGGGGTNGDGDGALAVVFDKNLTENSAYASVLAELNENNEKVWLVEYVPEREGNESTRLIKWQDGFMFVKEEEEEKEERREGEGAGEIREKMVKWHKIRACLRYVTQKPWRKLPVNSKTRLINPIIVCLAGGRNKIMASYAYKCFNEEQAKSKSGLSIRLPYSLINVNKADIPRIVREDPRLLGKAVVKVPYGNCGQGVYTILNERELDIFMRVPHTYDKFIVQSLVGHSGWWSQQQENNKKMENENENGSENGKQYFHIGTMPNRENNESFVFDLRLIVTSEPGGVGFSPVSMNCRRARQPLVKSLKNLQNNDNDDDDEQKEEKRSDKKKTFTSWDMLGTNLSIKLDKNEWGSEAERLLIMDTEDFGVCGMSVDDLIDGYIQTICSVISIDKMCIRLLESGQNGKFNEALFRQLNPDQSLFDEIRFD